MNPLVQIRPTFEELVADLHDRSDGASPSAHQAFARLSQPLLDSLDTTAAARIPDLTTALGFWTRNNSDIKAVTQLTTQDEISAYFDKAYPGHASVLSGANKNGWLKKKVGEAEDALNILKATWSQAPVLKPGVLGRGGVMHTGRFNELFQDGETVEWLEPTATTIEAEFVPLHFVRKNWAYLLGEGARPEDLTAYVLRIEDEDDIGVRGHWVARIPPPSRNHLNVEWQAEIVTAPGLKFEVTHVEELDAPWGRLRRVHAKLKP